MAWVYLLLAGVFEIVWAVCLKYTDGFTRLWPTAGVLVGLALSLGTLALALRGLPFGTAYAVWTGIGTVGAAVIGMIWFGDPVSALRILCIVLILSGIVGLKLVNG